MSIFLKQVQGLIDTGEVRISEHGYDELAEDELTARELLAGVKHAIIIEEYPDYSKGPCALTLQQDRSERPVHVVWGIPKGIINLLFLLRHTGQTQNDGMTVFYGGDNHEKA